MTLRATKRGMERTRLQRDCDVLICGASFAGLAVARELAGCGADVMLIDRYQIGERQTSACGIPTEWLSRLALEDSLRQSFGELIVHTPWSSCRWQLPWTFSTFDYRELCALLFEQAQLPDGAFETAKVDGISRALAADGLHTVHTDRGDVSAPLVIDALGWRRVLAKSMSIQPPAARLSRGLEVHPAGSGEQMQLWIDPAYVRAGYGWSFPAREELRVGVGSFWPAHHVKEPTVRLAGDLSLPAVGYQGNWIPHQLRPAVEGGVFFVGDSAGHCLPLTAEGIRTAFYFGLACGRELAAVISGSRTREQALLRYAAFSDSHEWKFRWLLGAQRAVGALTNTPLVTLLSRAMAHKSLCKWAFERYLDIAPPSFVDRMGPPSSSAGIRALAAPA